MCLSNRLYECIHVNNRQWFDLEAGVQKTIDFIDEAGRAGCKLVAFPEVCELPAL
jgi:predicted amidohydrolase